MKKVLVTGGAGYIGSHVVAELLDRGYDVEVLDNLSTGNIKMIQVPMAKFHHKDLRNPSDLLRVHWEEFDAVMHFAGSIVVPESVEKPLDYYNNNNTATLNLLSCMKDYEVKNLIFSSTAAIFEPSDNPLSEYDKKNPANPYGHSKLMTEQILDDCDKAYGIKSICLRYFNVAGADYMKGLGQIGKRSTHLIKILCEHLIGKRDILSVFGNDYPTPDGTCVRDYIHVKDLASAHVFALEHLLKNGESEKINCGYGRGFSILDVIHEAMAHTGCHVNYQIAPRRQGDPATLICDSTKLRKMGWKPKHDELGKIIVDAYTWEQVLSSALENGTITI
jgi:UDP-glucose 4-epimerase